MQRAGDDAFCPCRREHATLGHLHRAITEAMTTTAPRTPITHHPTYTYTTHYYDYDYDYYLHH